MQIRVTSAKRGKTRASKSRLDLVLLLIGRESGARFLLANHRAKQSKLKANAIYLRLETFTFVNLFEYGHGASISFLSFLPFLLLLFFKSLFVVKEQHND